jgi:hypothetical protein
MAAARSRSSATAPATVVGMVTNTASPPASRRCTSSLRFSSALATTRSGSSPRIAARSGFLVPRTLASPTSASAGSRHQSVTPTRRFPTPATTSHSVSDGTRLTTRSTRSGRPTEVPRASVAWRTAQPVRRDRKSPSS